MKKNFFDFFELDKSVFIDKSSLENKYLEIQNKYTESQRQDPKIEQFITQLNKSFNILNSFLERNEYIANLENFTTISSDELYTFISPEIEFFSYCVALRHLSQSDPESCIIKTQHSVSTMLSQMENALLEEDFESFALNLSKMRYLIPIAKSLSIWNFD